MNKKAKLVKRFRTLPKDFTFDEVESLFGSFDFVLDNKGSTSGSRVIFRHKDSDITYIMHKPHPSNIIKGYMMRQILDFLTTNKFIKD